MQKSVEGARGFKPEVPPAALPESLPAALREDLRGGVLVLTLAHPPVNAVHEALRAGLASALHRARTDAGVTALVLRGEGQGFSAGADIAEFGRVDQTLDLGGICLLIENLGKPSVAALHGAVLGGGLELALACHHRLALATARLGLPEVNLGLLPGAGGTQRLPRLIGATEALRLMLTGTPIVAAEALALGLLDLVVEGDLLEQALVFARSAFPRPTSEATLGLRPPRAYQEALARARQELAGQRLPAPPRIIDCIEAAGLLPMAQGLAFERAAFADLVATPESAGLRHAFFAERRAAFPPPKLAAAPMARVLSLGFWGAAPASDLALQALAGGMRVVLADPDRAALVASLERIAIRQEQAVLAGDLSPEARDADWARLTTVLDSAALAGVDMVLVAQDLPPLPEEIAPGARVASGGLVAGGAEGIALAAPLARGGLAEIALGETSTVPLGAQVLGFSRAMGWRIVFTGAGGTVEGRLRRALADGVAALEAAGSSRAEITAALAAFGMGTGSRPQLPAMPVGGMALVQSCLLALANAGARMLDAGTVRRPGDLDAVALHSGLLPRWEGGPMFWADRRGLLLLRADLQKRSRTPGDVFDPAVLIDRLIAEGQSFATLSRR